MAEVCPGQEIIINRDKALMLLQRGIENSKINERDKFFAKLMFVAILTRESPDLKADLKSLKILEEVADWSNEYIWSNGEYQNSDEVAVFMRAFATFFLADSYMGKDNALAYKWLKKSTELGDNLLERYITTYNGLGNEDEYVVAPNKPLAMKKMKALCESSNKGAFKGTAFEKYGKTGCFYYKRMKENHPDPFNEKDFQKWSLGK